MTKERSLIKRGSSLCLSEPTMQRRHQQHQHQLHRAKKTISFMGPRKPVLEGLCMEEVPHMNVGGEKERMESAPVALQARDPVFLTGQTRPMSSREHGPQFLQHPTFHQLHLQLVEEMSQPLLLAMDHHFWNRLLQNLVNPGFLQLLQVYLLSVRH